jgi:pyruvate/2-oxoglutarate dehydrogenase complex dihydrolipoamide dehydrogenase (E3) component
MERTVFLAAFIAMIHCYCAPYDYDCIVIGGGTAGTTAAHIIKHHKKNVAIVQKSRPDHIETIQSEIPSKIFIQIASQLYAATKLQSYGLLSDSSPCFDSTAIMSRVKNISYQIQVLHQAELTKENIPLIYGTASFIDSNTIAVGSKRLTAEQFIITTGSVAQIPPIEGIESIEALTIDTFFNQTSLPASIAIVGAGPVGIELACALARLKIKVVLFCKYKRLLPTFDQELVDLLCDDMKKMGITIIMQSTIYKVERNVGSINIHYNTPSEDRTISTEKLCIALNQKPCTQDLALENAGVATHPDGTIKVDVRMQTSLPHIWAAGDVTGSSYISNRSAYYQAKIAAHNSCLSWWETPVRTNIPFAIRALLSDPPFVCVGLSEQLARKLYKENILIYRCTYDQIDRSYIDSAQSGYAKCICSDSGILLGAHIYGKQACELITLLELGQKLDTQFINRSKELYISPSYTELLWKITEEARLSKKQDRLYSTFEKLKIWLKERLSL